MSSSKKDSVKGKIERTAGGARVMGLRTSSRAPSKKHNKPRATQMENPGAPMPEDVSNPSVPANAEDDVTTSSHDSDATLSDKPDKEASSKSSDSNVAKSTDALSEESMKTPPIVYDVSDDEDSEEVTLASVAARMLKRRRGSVEETPIVQKKKPKNTTGSSKSKATNVSRKGKEKAVESSGKKAKKTTGKKQKVSRTEVETDSDVEGDVMDITASEKKMFSSKRIPSDVPNVPLDNVSIHAPENAFKWKYVYQRCIAKEREIDSDVLACKEIMTLIARAGLRKTVMNIGKCYDKLVKEFIVNLSDDVNNSASPEFRKVFVRGKCVNFSPAIINQALERSVVEFVEEEPSLDTVAEELTAGRVKKWPAKKPLSTGFLSVKYAILNRIGVVNWVPSNHTSAVSAMLVKPIYRIGTEIAYDFGNFVFSQTLKHAETCAVKLPISFPSLLTAIILKQHPNILSADDVPVPKGPLITLDQRLFLEPHVLDIDLPSSRTYAPASVSTSGNNSVISELEAISKELQETIRIASARKFKVDALIQTLKGEAGQEGEPAADAEKEGSAENDEDNPSSSGI
ncbi:uncharacterized protein LOC130712157 [Lotus japonicus]|uniref:uncharacterized protein LOC130712157 n=1 Tax=Lotus japonicus TaxID=34305 RepID=UPI0025827B9E|nr:uncharacterized protein LOC130712157 [Lotus japonicus]